MNQRVTMLAVLALVLLLSTVHASAAVTIVQDPTLVAAASNTVQINFASLPASGNKIIVAFAVRGAPVTTTSMSVSDNQGTVGFIPTGGTPTPTPTGQHPKASTTIGGGTAAAITHATVGATSGSYIVTVTVTGAHHIVAKAWEVSGLPSATTPSGGLVDTSAPSDCWLTADYPAGASVCSGVDGHGLYHGGTRGFVFDTTQTHVPITGASAGTCALSTATTALIIAAARIEAPTNLTHLNTGGGWTRCTGCPVTDDVNSVGFDLVYRLSAAPGTYSDSWTFDVPADVIRLVAPIIAQFDAAP